MGFVTRVRGFLYGSDARRAREDERAVYSREEARRRRFDERQRDAYSKKGGVEIGRAVQGDWPVRVAGEALHAHAGIYGPSGAGKSYFLSGLLKIVLGSGTERIVVLDPKEETVALLKRALIDIANELPSQKADGLLGRVVLFDLFSGSHLPRLQVLRPPAGIEPGLHAYSMANLITRESDMDVGVRQEAVLVPTLECLIRAGLPLTMLPMVLESPGLLERLAAHVERAELLRQMAARIAKEPRERIMGLVARVERLMRLRATRLCFGGSAECLDFGGLLDRYVTLVNLAPPYGSADIGRFLAGNLWLQLSYAIRRRPNGSAPVHVVIDEFPAFLAGGGARLADTVEDLLRLARSKGVFLWLLTQDMASIAKISSSLPEVMRTNLHIHSIFRAASENAWDFALPVTGQRKMPRKAPWEKSSGSPYMSRSAELTALRTELRQLPDRECYFVDRRSGRAGVRMRTADLVLKAGEDEVRILEERAAQSPMVASADELQRGMDTVAARVNELLKEPAVAEGTVADDDEGIVPLRRGKRRGLGIG